MRKHAFSLVCLIILLFNIGCSKNSKVMKVMRVIDGDTIVLKPYMVVRIIGIDAPEVDPKSQKFLDDTKQYNVTPEEEEKAGMAAKVALNDLLHNKKVKIITSSNYHYERIDHNRIARNMRFVEVNGNDVAELLLNEGHVRVWNEKQFPSLNYKHEKDSLYHTLQESAKSRKVGLWKHEKTMEDEQK